MAHTYGTDGSKRYKDTKDTKTANVSCELKKKKKSAFDILTFPQSSYPAEMLLQASRIHQTSLLRPQRTSMGPQDGCGLWRPGPQPTFQPRPPPGCLCLRAL